MKCHVQSVLFALYTKTIYINIQYIKLENDASPDAQKSAYYVVEKWKE